MLPSNERGEMRTAKIPIESIEVAGRRALSQRTVERLAESMKQIGLMMPITVRRVPKGEGQDRIVLVVGGHRLAAAKLLGSQEIEAFVIEGADFKDSHVELWEIDENLMRHELDQAEHALLTGRRAEIITKARGEEEKAASPSQNGTRTARKKGKRNTKGVRDAASIRDQAERTGESKSKIGRSMKRAEKLGDETLRRVKGTSLAKGSQLDALSKLPAEAQEDLIKRAEAGEKVSAVRALQATVAKIAKPAKENVCPSCGAPSNWRKWISDDAPDAEPTIDEAA